MKTIVFITAIFTFTFFAGCSTTTHFSLKQTYPEYIEKELNKVEKDSGVGVEVSLLLNNGNDVNGELLSVRETTIILCSEYSATEEELAKLTYPILLFPNNEIQQLTIEGTNWVWEGIAAGAVIGASTALILGMSGTLGEGGTKEENQAQTNAVVFVFSLCFGAGWGIGYALSTEEYVLQEIPPNYNWSILKPLSRYPNREPEYLRAIE